MTSHVAEISHEFQAGPSGPARSYWDVYHVTDTGTRLKLGMVCQPPTAGKADFGHLDIPQLVNMLDEAFSRGQAHKQAEIKRVIGA